MHMSDALVSPPVAAVAGGVSLALIALAARRLRRPGNEQAAALMGVMGAFVFTAQLVNFAIPGTGSSGHIVGGVLLAAVLGPWASFITLSSVLAIQALFFADGGLLAWGCNTLNIAAASCLVAYPLLFRQVAAGRTSFGRILSASVVTSTVGLVIGAVGVTLETELSGITAIPTAKFLLFMVPIHVVIGIAEGVATGAVLFFLFKYKPELRDGYSAAPRGARAASWRVVALFVGAIMVVGGVVSRYASTSPDGLEWSVGKVEKAEAIGATAADRIHAFAQQLQDRVTLMPGYELKKDGAMALDASTATSALGSKGETSLAGLVGALLVVALALGVGVLLRTKIKSTNS